MAHVGQSRPDSGLRFQVTVLEHFEVVPSSLGIGRPKRGTVVCGLFKEFLGVFWF